jgi:cytochrome c oxidase assembly protein subunit 15
MPQASLASKTTFGSGPDARPVAPGLHRWVAVWLWLVAALVLVMIGVGGATRLTGSGLSITEWQPIMGAIPPLSDADWAEAFAKYKLIPQYTEVNKGMSLADFKTIFWWEWGHRFLGRFIGVAFALPLLWFWWRGALGGRLSRQLLGLLALGGLQGAMGWYMVMSGLTERVSVSQYRLAAHLGLAIVILGALVWIALDLGARQQRSARLDTVSPSQRRTAWWLTGLILAQILLGALVAGLKAGLTYNTWPLMDGKLVPNGLFSMEPWWINSFENITAVQFNHRMMAYVVLIACAWHAWSVHRVADDGRVSGSAWVLLAAVVAQAGLGIWTLLEVVPLSLGIAHQMGAAVVFAVAVWHLHCVHRAAAR